MTRPRPACLHVAPVLGCRGFWLLAAAGGLLVAAVLGYLLSLHFGRDLSPPELGVRVTGVSASRPGHLVRSSVCNHGGQAAAQVRVEGRLVTAGGEEELSKATLDYAPGLRAGRLGAQGRTVLRRRPAGRRAAAAGHRLRRTLRPGLQPASGPHLRRHTAAH